MAIESAAGAPITGLSSMATRRVLAELVDAYARTTGQRVTIESVGGVDAARRVRDGEAFDFVVLAGSAIESLAAAGRIDARSRVDVARSGVAIAVAAGARRPDIGSARPAVRAARILRASSSAGASPKPPRRGSCRRRPAFPSARSWRAATPSSASSS